MQWSEISIWIKVNHCLSLGFANNSDCESWSVLEN